MEKHRGLSESMVSPELERIKLINNNLHGEVNRLKSELEKVNEEKEK